jgi:hypothetical protein
MNDPDVPAVAIAMAQGLLDRLYDLESRCLDAELENDQASSAELRGRARGIAGLAADIEGLLRDRGLGLEPPELAIGERWELGLSIAEGPLRRIHAGFLRPMVRLTVIRSVPGPVVALLRSIGGDRDFLKGERHSGVGWHYHYLDWRKRRSNVILCWDTRAPGTARRLRPLFHEKHGEGGKHFSARPDLWGSTKRESIHDACAPDLARWPLEEFRCASNDASPVWPDDAVVMIRPGPSQPIPSRGGKRRAR